jgi:SAM-dependent methyltransferase/glycosyltransferase involved in cell wall biosynthesis
VKPLNTYYANINFDLLNRIPLSAQNILEIGCGQGKLGAAFKDRQPLSRYFGVELMPAEAKIAATNLDGVVCANIELDHQIPKKFLTEINSEALFDALVLGDVLEHLQDPWRLLSEAHQWMAPNSTCIICIPNVGHWSVVQQLLKGRFDYAEAGLLDKTHLRFFTLETAVEMLSQVGWTVVEAIPRTFQPEKTQEALNAIMPIAKSMNLNESKLKRDLSAFQWVIRAVRGVVPAAMCVGALGLKKFAGVTEARVDYPLTALNSLVSNWCVWGYGTISIPSDFKAGILILQRQFMNNAGFNTEMEKLIQDGWTLVADMDDDPHHWPQFVDSNFYAYRAVHAITVSTPHLANMMNSWNPHVKVFPNAVMSLPFKSVDVAKETNRPIRVFFGALNRKTDWQPIMSAICEVIVQLEGKIEFVVVHDKEFFDALPPESLKTFHPTLNHANYMEVLSACDVALLPLNDTPFNRCKSDIKLIECAAAGVAVICSKVVYAEDARHESFAKFATNPQEWRSALLHLAQNPNDLINRQNLGLEYSKKHRMHAHQVLERDAYYRGLIENRKQLEADRQSRLKQLKLSVQAHS